MFGIHDYWFFLASGIIVNLIPGQDTAYILGRGISQGRVAGIASVLGVATGSVIHTLGVALGLSVLLGSCPWAFLTLRVLGASYLVYLGMRCFFDSAKPFELPERFTEIDTLAVFRQGMLTNLLNPKVALFFLAFLPQFVDPLTETRTAAFLLLGLSFVATGTLWFLILVMCASFLGEKLRTTPGISAFVSRAVGAMFIVLGARIALS